MLLHFSWALKHLRLHCTFFLQGRTITFNKSLTARFCTFHGFTKWNMFVNVNVTVLQQLLRAKSEVSSYVLIRQDTVSCGNGVEVVFVLVDDDTQDVVRVPLPLSIIGTGRATLPLCCQLAPRCVISWPFFLLDLSDTLLPSSCHSECCAVQVMRDWAVAAERLEADHQAERKCMGCALSQHDKRHSSSAEQT